jgi:hypothetical protein
VTGVQTCALPISHLPASIFESEDIDQFTQPMASVTLVHTEETFTIPVVQAITKFSLFQNNLTLATSPYQVQSSVTLSIFREFLSALGGQTIAITNTNFRGLQQLCEEFGFSDISTKLSEFRSLMDVKKKEEAENSNARGGIAALEEKGEQHSRSIAILQSEVRQLSTDFGRLVGEVSALRSAAAGIQTLSEEVCAPKTQIGQKQNDLVVEQLLTDFSELRKEVLTLKSQIAAMSPTGTPSQNQPPSSAPPLSQSSPVPLLDSRIISDFPEILAEFRKKQISLLWRHSFDGFKGQAF